VLWTAFPTVFGSIASTLSIPLFAAGVGIIIRGAAYALRTAVSTPRQIRLVDTMSAASSVLTPLALGMAVGGIASRRVPVGILSQATNGHPERSTRFNELLAPSGIPFELRAAFVSRGRVWGAVHLARREDRHDFTAEDAAVLARVTGVIADGIRTSLRFDAAREARGASAPGLVILGPSDEVEMITPPARELMGAMESHNAGPDGTPPSPLLALAAFARSEGGLADQHGPAVAVPTSEGWVTLHASLPEGSTGSRVAIVLERTSSRQSTAIRLEADGVTPREREIATLLAQGLSNAEIAEALVLSPFTIQDHIKNLFEKTGVSSRQELVARIFLDDYIPHLARRAPLTSRGTFAGER
jgi:DNA-binding CsgD family transcriptional regulator